MTTPIITIDEDFGKIEGVDSRLKVSACYQCRRCTNGCPVTFAMDIYPDKIIRLVNLGQIERVLKSHTIWICSSCQTCTTRCPNDVDIAEVMDSLKEMAVQSGIRIPEPRSYAFHEAFLRDIGKRGRVFESGMLQSYMIRSGDLLRKFRDGTIREDIALGFKMFRKGRMPLLPHGIKGKKDVRDLIKRG
ncbi:MAG: 4Fe-4S dicluster domain-containing protein [Pseudomonadota bacterium]